MITDWDNLFARRLRGDSEAEGLLYERSRRFLRAVWSKRFRAIAQPDSEDAILDTIDRVWRWLEKTARASGGIPPYKPSLLKFFKRKMLGLLPREPVPPDDCGPEPGEPAEQDFNILIADCLRKMSPAERQAFSLHHFEGHSKHEVARLMDRPIGPIKDLIFHAEQKMWSLLR